MKITCLLHSLLKKIQEWSAVMWPIRPHSSILQIELAFGARKLGKSLLRVMSVAKDRRERAAHVETARKAEDSRINSTFPVGRIFPGREIDIHELGGILSPNAWMTRQPTL
jgi:hypothetical protein